MLVDEAETSRARTILEHDPEVLVWWGTAIECASAISRLERETNRTADDARAVLDVARSVWSEVLASEEVRNHAVRLLRRHPLRAADALQLGAALTWARGQPSTHGFATLDSRLRTAARGEGFVLPFG